MFAWNKIILIWLSLVWGGVAYAILPTYIQSAQSFDSTSGSVTTVTLTAPVIGNFIVCAHVVTSIDNSQGYTLVDNQAAGGNSYTQVTSTTLTSGCGDTACTLFLDYAPITKSSGSFVITLTKTTTPADFDVALACHEYSGINTLSSNPNIKNTGNAASGTTASPGAINANNVNSLYFTAVLPNFASGGTALNSFTQRLTSNGTTAMISTADIVGNGSKTGSFTITSSPWVAAAMALNPSLVTAQVNNGSMNGITNIN